MADATLSIFVDESGRFQIPDMVATLKLVELKLEHGDMMTESEYKFFGGPRNFKRNILKYIKRKEI